MNRTSVINKVEISPYDRTVLALEKLQGTTIPLGIMILLEAAADELDAHRAEIKRISALKDRRNGN